LIYRTPDYRSLDSAIKIYPNTHFLTHSLSPLSGTFVDVPDFAVLLMSLPLLATLLLLASLQMLAALLF
jgi:hypothetical protein